MEELESLYKRWTTTLAANPAMAMDDLRDMIERWGDVTAEPGGVDYMEVDAAGVPAILATPKDASQAGSSYASMPAASSAGRCTDSARASQFSVGLGSPFPVVIRLRRLSLM